MSQKDNQRAEYISRINRVTDYINAHLQEDLSLAELAKVACFSPFHFHRVFGAMVGEPLSQYIQRLRVEKAAALLVQSSASPITDIALNCGFSSSATFARTFKKWFGISASEYRDLSCDDRRKICKTKSNHTQPPSNPWKEIEVTVNYPLGVSNQLRWRIDMTCEPKLHADVLIQEIPATTVAYVRHVGPYKGDSDLFRRLFEQLFRWAGPRGLFQPPATQALCVYHDNPHITDEDKLRTSVCITVPADTVVEGEIGKMTLHGGRYAVAKFEIDATQFEEAWNMVYGAWLPQSGFQPEDYPPFERYLGSPDEHPEHKFLVEICIPVKPL